MDNKIGSIDNDGNVTSNTYEDFNDDMTSSITETNSYDTSSYDSGNKIIEETNEEFDVFGNSKEEKEKKPIGKWPLFAAIGIVLLVIILILVMTISSANKYTVETKNVEIKVKETEEIEVKAKDKVKNKLTYKSEDKKIAKVDGDGTITGVSVGKTTIYVGINGKKTHAIKVRVETNKEELVLKESNITIAKGEPYQLQIKNVLEDDVFEWTSNNELIAEVDQNGVVTGIHGGTTTIVVRESDGRKVSAKVTVTSDEVLIEKMSLEPQTIAIGEKVQLKPTVYPSDALTILKWKSSKESVVEVDENGVVTGIAAGTSTITAESHNGKKVTAKITVDPKLPASIKLSGCTGGIAIGTPVKLEVEYSPDTAKSTITWTSSNTNIATVSGGKVTGKAVGNVVITAETKNGKKATCKLKVNAMAVQSIKLSTTNFTLDQEATKKLSVSFTPSKAEDFYTVTWKSSNTKVAKVANDGTVTGIGPGTAKITASAGGKSATATVTVNATSVTGIQLDGCISTIEAGDSFKLTARITPTTAKNKTITWSSSNSTIASVSSGTVSAKKAGTVTITATSNNGKKATCTVVVTNPPITELELSETSVKLKVGESVTITAETNLTSTNFKKYYTMKWTSSNSAAATVTPNSTNSLKATIKGVAKGATTIHVTVGSINKTIQVVVE